MKSFSWLQTVVSCVVLGLGPLTSVRAQQAEDFKVVNLHPTSSVDLIKVGKNWRKDLPQRIQASLYVGQDTLASTVFVKAYFYDRDGKLVATYAKPNTVWMSTGRGMEEVDLPKLLTRARNTDVFFAIPEDLQMKKWTTVVVVFGNADKVAAGANPSSALSKLEFPEKARLAPAPL